MVKIVCIVVFIVIAFLMLQKKQNNGSMYNGIIFGALVYYGIIPLIMELNKEDFVYKRNYLDMGTGKYVLTYFMITMFLVFFYVSVHSFFGKKDVTYVPNENILYRNMRAVGYFCFFVGGGTLILFFAALGGVTTALSIAERARSFSTSLTDFMPYYASLLVVPARLVTVAPFCFWVLEYQQGKSRKYRIYMIAACILSVLFYLFNAGKAQILAMILCLVVPIMLNMRIKHAWCYIIMIGVVSLPLLDVLDQLFVYMQTGRFVLGQVNYVSYITQFSPPINNVFHAFEIGNEYGYRYGSDFITTVLDLLPGLNFEPSYVPTSSFYGGASWRMTGGTPNDLITLSVLEFHVLGIFIVPFVLGKIVKLVDGIVRNCKDIRIRRVLATVLAVYSFLLVQSADPQAIFRAFILWMLPLTIIASKSRRKNEGELLK